MQSDILHKGSYATLRCVLTTNEEIRAETGAMLAMDESAHIEGAMRGGLWGALKRTVLTSESFFVTTIRASQPDTEVYLAPRTVGDIEKITLQSEEYIVQGGSFLASTKDIVTDTHFSGWKGFFSGEGIFMIKVSGTGEVFVSSFGAIIEKKLKAGEKFIVDNGHIVAFASSIAYEIVAVGGGMVGAVKTGEGLACCFTGPGTLFLQSRNLQSFAESLNPFLRNREVSKGAGLLGQVLGG